MAAKQTTSPTVALVPPALVLLGYAWFIVTTYRPYLDWHFRLQSPDLAGLPEDVIGYGFWMWWPVAALIFVFALGMTLFAFERRWRVALVFVGLFALLSSADYLLCQRLVQELIRPVGRTPAALIGKTPRLLGDATTFEVFSSWRVEVQSQNNSVLTQRCLGMPEIFRHPRQSRA